jgi:hypothetical protein
MLKMNLIPIVVLCSVVVLLPSGSCQWGNNNGQNQGPPMNKTDGPPIQAPGSPLPYALSSTYLTYLARTEQELYKDIKHYAKSLRERLQIAEASVKNNDIHDLVN